MTDDDAPYGDDALTFVGTGPHRILSGCDPGGGKYVRFQAKAEAEEYLRDIDRDGCMIGGGCYQSHSYLYEPSANGFHHQDKGDAYEPSDQPNSGPSRSKQPGLKYNPKLYKSAPFFEAKFTHEWLIRNALVRYQPGVIGGPKKALKSSIAIDLAISLASATPFLGVERFSVPQRFTVMLLNGESGNATIQETGRRIAQERGLDPKELDIIWGWELPQLSNIEHLGDLAYHCEDNNVNVLIIDPVYLCLLAGSSGVESSNSLDMGEVYNRVATRLLETGTTSILAVHARKAREKKPLDLDDLAHAGIAEHVRQWMLLNRREEYQGDGQHKLWLNLGGSAGFSFLGELDIDEGSMSEDFTGKTWKVSLAGYQQAKREKKSSRDAAKADERQQDEWAIMRLIDDLTGRKEVATQNRVRKASPLSRDRTDGALERLRLARLIDEYTATVPKGNKATQEAAAYRRIRGSE